jgi:hypothetical protein
MSFSINNIIPQSNDLLEDIKGLQSLLDAKIALYGDALVQNGLQWKAMGMPVDQQLLDATRDWLHRLCIGLLSALDAECKKVQSLVSDMQDLLSLPLGEKVRLHHDFITFAKTLSTSWWHPFWLVLNSLQTRLLS